MDSTETPKKKSYSKISSILSLLFMGLGQFYNRQFIKGGIFAAIEIYFIASFYPWFNYYVLWGLRTLGERPQETFRGRIVYVGDHSIVLMIMGIIYLLAFLFFILFYVLNVRDAYKVGKLRENGQPVNTFIQTFKGLFDHGFPYLLLIPSVFFTAFLTILPLLFGILIAFTNYSGPNHLPPKSLVNWVGLQSFIDLFQMKSWSNTFYGVFTWTCVWAVIATISTFFVGLFFAVLINDKDVKFKKFWRSIFILPWAIPGFIATLIMRNIFNGQFGPLNQYIKSIGDMLAHSHIGFLVQLSHQSFFSQGIDWLADPTWAKVTLFIVNTWFGFPYWMILMSGVMTGIDTEMFEAADVDGASAWQKFWKITLPIIMFSTAPLLIMSFANNFNNFNLIYFLTDGGPVNSNYSYAGSTDILISWIYNMTLNQNKFNMASVVSILIFIVVATLSIWNFSRTKAFKEEDMMS